MSSQSIEVKLPSVSVSDLLFFAGDQVRLAGQMDYPLAPHAETGYPLIFIIQHATCTSRHGYLHFARLGTELGMAVFRWDKRGTGNSGSGGEGTVTGDTLAAYEMALTQKAIDRNQVIILAQNEGSLLLSEAYEQFTAIQKPLGVILAGNMLDEKQIISIKAPVQVLVSKNDWNDWRIYAETATNAHNRVYKFNSSFFVAPNTNRRLMYDNGGAFHRGAAQSITDWLKTRVPSALPTPTSE
jgi:hypothetical protein